MRERPERLRARNGRTAQLHRGTWEKLRLLLREQAQAVACSLPQRRSER
ncbi:hypothetical protein ABT090_33610 [Streptomyces asoensis]